MKAGLQKIKFYKNLIFVSGLICFFALVVSTNSYGHLHNSPPSELSKHQKKKYKKDATRLALRLLSDGQSLENMDAKVPAEMVESIFNALVAVHHSELEAAKEVTQVHKLHTFPIPSVDRMVVVYERGAQWATPLRLGDDVTDNQKINNLSEQYNLKIDRHVEWDEEHNSFNLKAKESFNVAPVAKDLSEVENVALVDMMEPAGDGNDIAIKPLEDGWEINYMVKFDGCLAGCKKIHTWKFEVRNDGTVEFKGESGDELPDWMR